MCFCWSGASRLVKRQQNPDFFFPSDDNDVRPNPNPQPTQGPFPTQNPIPTQTPATNAPQSTTNFPGLSETTTAPPPGYFTCLQSCPTTNEYNPICGSNRVQYFNEQKFNCARRCGVGKYS